MKRFLLLISLLAAPSYAGLIESSSVPGVTLASILSSTNTWSATQNFGSFIDVEASTFRVDAGGTHMDGAVSHTNGNYIQTSGNISLLGSGTLQSMPDSSTPDFLFSGSTKKFTVGDYDQTRSTKVTFVDSANTYVVGIGSSTTGSYYVDVSTNGHLNSQTVTGSTVTSCGTLPSFSGSDVAGKITVGGGVVTACTLTFAKAFSSAPVCVFSDDSTSVTGDISAVSGSAITFSFSATIGGGHIYYHCIGSD